MKPDPWNLVLAIQVSIESNYLSYNTSELQNMRSAGSQADTGRQDTLLDAPILHSDLSNPETQVIKQNLIDMLSKAGLEMYQIIVDTPKEALTPKTENLTMGSIIQYFKRRKWPDKKIERSLREIRQMLKEAQTV